MRIIESGTMDLSMKRPVVGCGIQGDNCLAMQVSQLGDRWTVEWALPGIIGDPAFASQLSAATGKTPFWTSVTEEGALPSSVTVGVELPSVARSKKNAKMRVDAMRTQAQSRLANPSPVVLRGVEIYDEDAKLSHLVGGLAIKERVEADFKSWRKIMKIRYPHIGSTDLAIANTYLALYEPASSDQSLCRIIFLEGRDRTRAVVIDDWKFVDAIYFQNMEGQTLDDSVIRHWTDDILSRRPFPEIPKPLIILNGDSVAEVTSEVWHPFSSSFVTVDPSLKKLVETNLDLSTVAFGMALQGGI